MLSRRKLGSQAGSAEWRGIAFLAAVFSVFALFASQASHASQNPDFVLGYVTGVLERSHGLLGFDVGFEGEFLVVDLARKPGMPLDTIERALLEIDGVEAVRIQVAGVFASEKRQTERPPVDEAILGKSEAGGADGGTDEGDEPSDDAKYDFISPYQMFDSLIADPRWPHFSVIHQWYLDEDELGRVGSANFGESFSLVRSPENRFGQWEVGFQAGVFSVFDLQADSNDLVNSDFLIGLTATHHYGDFTSMIRLYHQSSHLGDEFLLRNPVDRVNLSFEVLDLLVSYDPTSWLRLYGGGGVIVHREPRLDRGILQSGIELRSPVAFGQGFIRPLAALDMQFREESDWDLDASLRVGFQIEHPYLRRSEIQVLAEFYRGRSPNGQFFERRIETAGIGLHLGF